MLIGGETLGKGLGETLRELFAPADLIDIYGLTETSTCDFFLMPADVPRYAGCIGRASPGVRYRIVGDDGELHISSPYLMNGYLDEPGSSRSRTAGSPPATSRASAIPAWSRSSAARRS